MTDPINHPPHYTSHPSGIEPITITKHMNFCLGNVIKYVMRADYKGNRLEDLKKAQYYLNLEILDAEMKQKSDYKARINAQYKPEAWSNQKAIKDGSDPSGEPFLTDLCKVIKSEESKNGI